MEYVLISTAVGGVVLFVLFFLRSAREAREEFQGAAMGNGTNDFWSDKGAGASAAVLGMFSSEDQQFIAGEDDRQVAALFRRERRRLALRWIERQKCEAAVIMRRHREASRSAADLKPSSEVALFLRYGQVRLMFEFLAFSVWLGGPEGLRGLAQSANTVFSGIENAKTLRGDKQSASL